MARHPKRDNPIAPLGSRAFPDAPPGQSIEVAPAPTALHPFERVTESSAILMRRKLHLQFVIHELRRMSMLKRLLLTVCVVLSVACPSSAALVLNSVNVVVQQNFDLLGTATNLSTLNTSGWVFGTGATPTFAGGVASVTQVHSSGATFATGGTYNFGGLTGDRAIGAMTSGSFTTPNHIMLQILNSTGSTLTQLNFGFDWERFRVNTAAANGTFFTSNNGSTWTAFNQGDSGAYSTGASAYSTPTPGSALDTIAKTGSVTGLSIANGQNYYLRWTIDTTGVNSQAIGIDNFTVTGITAVPEPSSFVLAAIVGVAGLLTRKRTRRVVSRTH